MQILALTRVWHPGCTQEVRNKETGKSRWYILSQSQEKYKELTDMLIQQYDALRKGWVPGNTSGKFDRQRT